MKRHVFICLFSFFLSTHNLLAQFYPFMALDENFNTMIKNKTKNLFPSDTVDHKVTKIIIFDPFIEYRHYHSCEVNKSLWDSSFASKITENSKEYTIEAKKQWQVKDYFGYKIHTRLKIYTDTSLILTSDSSFVFVKKELDSIMCLAKTNEIGSYKISSRLVNYLKQYNKAMQFVFTDVLVYQDGMVGDADSPNQYFKITMFVFDMYTQKIFYYNNRYQSNCIGFSDFRNPDGYRNLDNVKVLNTIIRKYKHYLKKYTQQNK
jgi:hypothetical protein